MAAKDYEIVTGLKNAYLAKKKKPTKKGLQIMSQDRRPITDGEMIGLFEFYLRKWCEEHEDEDTVTAKRNQLTVKFSIHYDKEKATQGR